VIAIDMYALGAVAATLVVLAAESVLLAIRGRDVARRARQLHIAGDGR
jgi:hypothetical protein